MIPIDRVIVHSSLIVSVVRSTRFGISLDRQLVNSSVALIIVAFMGLLALTSLFRASTTSVPSTVVTLVTLLVGLLFSLGIEFVFYRYMIKGD